MRRVLVAGATGYLGRYLIEALHRHGYWVRALFRDEKRVSKAGLIIDEVFVGEVTKPETLKGVANNVDVVMSTIGITRQKDGLTYQDVDYQGNANLLKEALVSGVKKFIYVSVLNAKEIQGLQIVQAKERFVKELQERGIDYAVIRPNGFFSDMREFLNTARRGRVVLFGDGNFRINPIHGRDVAEECIGAIESPEREISFGGPEVFTHREIYEEAFRALRKEPKFSSIPACVAKIALGLMRLLTSRRFYGPIEFALTVLTRDMVGEARGKEGLREFFQEEVRKEPPPADARKHG